MSDKACLFSFDRPKRKGILLVEKTAFPAVSLFQLEGVFLLIRIWTSRMPFQKPKLHYYQLIIKSPLLYEQSTVSSVLRFQF